MRRDVSRGADDSDRRSRIFGGLTRLGFATVAVTVAFVFTDAAPYRPPLLAYLTVCAVSVILAAKEIGESWRPVSFGIIDIAMFTMLAHLLGSTTTPIVVSYIVIVLLAAITRHKSTKVSSILAMSSTAIYGLVVLGESLGVLDYAPAIPHSVRPQLVQVVIALCAVAGGVGIGHVVARTIVGQLRREMAKSDSLLLNVLPRPIAAQLKDQSETIAESFPEVTVLFADVAGFTPMASKLAPEDVVDILNKVFTEFDHLAERHGLEKIKTIGDAYMVAGGLPEPRGDHAEAVADMALEMIEAVKGIKTPTGDPLDLRVGIHTGPVVAGVIGKKKFSYDLWGDTVNTASRMESHGAPGRIHVTEAVFEKLEVSFEFEERGPISVKGKGEMRTYFLIGKRTCRGKP